MTANVAGILVGLALGLVAIAMVVGMAFPPPHRR